MKAISIYPRQCELSGVSLPVIRLFADSAIGRDVMPLFVPDLPLQWHTRVCLAARIVRLGKNIARKFALRYVDAIGLVNVLCPEGENAADFTASGGLQILDGVVTTGQWIDVNAAEKHEVIVEVNGISRCYVLDETDIAGSICAISRLATLKTGDIIILESTAIVLPLVIDTKITGHIDGKPCLNLKIK